MDVAELREEYLRQRTLTHELNDEMAAELDAVRRRYQLLLAAQWRALEAAFEQYRAAIHGR